MAYGKLYDLSRFQTLTVALIGFTVQHSTQLVDCMNFAMNHDGLIGG